MDAEGNLVRKGWSRAHSIPATEDGVRLPMRGQNEEDLSDLHQQTVRLRFYLRDALCLLERVTEITPEFQCTGAEATAHLAWSHQ